MPDKGGVGSTRERILHAVVFGDARTLRAGSNARMSASEWRNIVLATLADDVDGKPFVICMWIQDRRVLVRVYLVQKLAAVPQSQTVADNLWR